MADGAQGFRKEAAARRVWPLAVVLVVAVGVRLAYLRDVSDLPDFDTPAVDAAYHDYWAWGLVTGEWPAPGGQITSEPPGIEKHPFFRPPGYPYFLAAVYGVFGHDYLTARVAQLLLGAVSCLLLAILGTRLFGRAAGVVAGLAMAVYWPLVYFEAELQPPILVVFLEISAALVALAAHDRGSWLLAGAAGALLGLAALVVPNFVVAAFAVAVWLGLSLRPSRGWRAMRPAAAVLCGTVAAISPAAIRNFSVSGELVPISTNLGINLWAGNGPRANGWDVNLPEFGTSFDHLRVVREVEAKVGRRMSHTEVSRYFARRAWLHVRREPGRAAALVLKKAVFFWGNTEIFSNKELNFARGESRTLRLLPVSFSWVLATALAGLLLVRRRFRRPDAEGGDTHALHGPGAVLLLALVGALFVSYLPFFVNARYRIPVVPLLLVFSAAGAIEVVAFVRARRWLAASACVVAAVVVAQIAALDPYGVRPRAVHWHHYMGVTHARRGEDAKALNRLDRALRGEADHVPSLVERGKVLARMGRRDEAIRDFEAILSVEPGHPTASLELGLVLAREGRIDDAIAAYRSGLRRAPDDPLLHTNLGVALVRAGRPSEAVEHHRAAIRSMPPPFADGHTNLGVALAESGRLREAERSFRDALRLAPHSRAARANLARVLALAGREEEAIPHLRESLGTISGFDGHLALGTALADLGIHAAAAGELGQAVDLRPDSLEARAGLVSSLLALREHDRALETLEEAVRRSPDAWFFVVGLADLLATYPEPERRDGERALSLAERAFAAIGDRRPEAGEALAAALAEVGRVDEAVGAAERALDLARTTRDGEVAERLEREIASYRAGLPWRRGE